LPRRRLALELLEDRRLLSIGSPPIELFNASPALSAEDLDWASFLGGANNDYGRAVAVDDAGNALITGYTYSPDFPTRGGFDTDYNGGEYDAFVAKVTASGELAWASFLGGSDKDYGYAIATDDDGSALITGWTFSADFPTPGGFDTESSGCDVFVAKVTSDGDLAWASFLGGTKEDWGSGIAVDPHGNALITGGTYSADFPTPGGFETSAGGNSDAFVAKLTSDGQLDWASYLGGSDYDHGHGIAADHAGSALITGGTYSPDFPTPGGFDTSHDGSYHDAFIAKVTSDGELDWASFLGGSSYDYGHGIAADHAGCALITGYTFSPDFPTPGGFDTSCDEGEAFVAKVTSAGVLDWASFLGGGSWDYARAVAVDHAGCALIAGYTYSSDFPTPDGFDTDFGGGEYDAFVANVTSGGELSWASFLGGSGDDCAHGIAIDAAGSALLAGETSSSDFPTPAGFDTSLGGQYDAFLARLGQPAEVVGRHLFYNNSYFDNPDRGLHDDHAIAPKPPITDPSEPNKELGKEALLPGGTAGFKNYTSYSRGINGIMVDIAGLPAATLTAADFTFKVGNDNTPGHWDPAPNPGSILVRTGAGVDDSDRVTLIWPDHAIENKWLQVTVKATTNTGLAAPDVFYFGNAIGESGDSTLHAMVTSADEIGARHHPHVFDPAPIQDAYDFDRNGLVISADQIIARHHFAVFDALNLITVPPLPPGGEALGGEEVVGSHAPASAVPGLVLPASDARGNILPDPTVFAAALPTLRQTAAGISHWVLGSISGRKTPIGPATPGTATVDAASTTLGGRHGPAHDSVAFFQPLTCIDPAGAATLFESLGSGQLDQPPTFGTSRPDRRSPLPQNDDLLPGVDEELLEQLLADMPRLGP